MGIHQVAARLANCGRHYARIMVVDGADNRLSYIYNPEHITELHDLLSLSSLSRSTLSNRS
jgi:hypothetical protein